VNVKLSLCLIQHHAIKTYGRVKLYLYAFLTVALDGGEWSASHLGRFTPKAKSSPILMDRKVGGPQGQLGCSAEKKMSLAHQRNPTFISQPSSLVSIPYELSWLICRDAVFNASEAGILLYCKNGKQ
jgi:hypothetical protein